MSALLLAPLPLAPLPLAPLALPATADVGAGRAVASTSPGAIILGLIPNMPFGAPATNVTIDGALVERIEAEAAALEARGAKNNAKSADLAGNWLLIYSNGREITNLASGLPLGFALGPTYQPLDPVSGRFENIGNVEHVLGLARASTRVIGDVRVAPIGTTNAAGTVNQDGNRVDVDFRRLTFALDEVLGRPTRGLRKVIVPKQDPAAAQPANDVTYLDDVMRITRGGDDSLFIFLRCDDSCREARPMLTMQEREALYAEGGEAAVTGNGVAGEGASPELRRLLKER